MENSITNAKTGNAYQGGNLKTLQAAMAKGGFTDPRFVTYNDARDMGYWVRKGSKAAARIKGQSGTYCVFSVEQTTIPALPSDEECAAQANEALSTWDDQEQPEPTYEDHIVYSDPMEAGGGGVDCPF